MSKKEKEKDTERESGEGKKAGGKEGWRRNNGNISGRGHFKQDTGGVIIEVGMVAAKAKGSRPCAAISISRLC